MPALEPARPPELDSIGLAGAVAAVAWPLFRTRKHMLLAQAAISVFFGLHFALEGASTGAAMNTVALTQALLAIPRGERPRFCVAHVATLPLIGLAGTAKERCRT